MIVYIYADLDGPFWSTDVPTEADLEFYATEGLDLFKVEGSNIESWDGDKWKPVPKAELRADGYHVKGKT